MEGHGRSYFLTNGISSPLTSLLDCTHSLHPSGVLLILAPQAQGPVCSLSQCADLAPLPLHAGMLLSCKHKRKCVSSGVKSCCLSTPLPLSGAALGLGKPSLSCAQPDRCPRDLCACPASVPLLSLQTPRT